MIENLKNHNFKLYPDSFIEFKKLLIINPMHNNLVTFLCLPTKATKSQVINHMQSSIITKYNGGRKKQMDLQKLVLLSKTMKIKMPLKK